MGDRQERLTPDLSGRHVVVTAGGNREPIDPIRFIGNRSSGKMGFALADAATERGGRVTLVTTVSPAEPGRYERVQLVETFSEMRAAVLGACRAADVLIMAAAVSDFHVVSPARHKIKKRGESILVELSANPDFLLELPDSLVKVGFAAETEDLAENAREKLRNKRLHFICANDVSAPDAGFGVDTNRVTILHATGQEEALPLLTKVALAHQIIDRVLPLVAGRSPVSASTVGEEQALVGPATSDLREARRRYADEVRYRAAVVSPDVIRAFATVPRERFLGGGPWRVLNQFSNDYWTTEGANPMHVYHDVLVALDERRRLNNGQPSLWAFLFDHLNITKGHRVLHVGCGTGYYTAILAELVGPAGHVTAIEQDQELSQTAQRDLLDWENVEVIHGDGCRCDCGTVNSIVVSAGATHPVPRWLDALALHGELLLPLTTDAGRGGFLRITREADRFAAEGLCRTGIFPCAGGRDLEASTRLAAALDRGGAEDVKSLRRDAHESDESCWLHVDGVCLSKRG